MRAAVYRGPGDLRVESRPRPEPGPGEVVLRVEACGICGTDLRIVDGHHRAYAGDPARVPGHEVVGVVASAGEGSGVREGDRFFVAPNIGCGACRECLAGRVSACVTPEALGVTRDGGLAEYVLVPARGVEAGNLLPVPPDADAAALTLAEPLACVLRGQRPLAVGAGDVVVVMGAGPIGLVHLAAVRAHAPACVIVSARSPHRRAEASARGADVVVDPAADDLAEVVAAHSAGGRGADVVIVAVPVAASQREAVEVAAPGGRVSLFAGLPRQASTVELDTNLVHYKELLVAGTSGNTVADCAEALALVAAGRIDTSALVGERYSLAEVGAAVAAARSGRALKVVVEP